MLFNYPLLTVLLTCVGKALSDTTNFTLYAYGTGIAGYPLFYADGLAYVGRRAPSFAQQAVNLTQSLNNTEIVGTPERTMNWPSQPTLSIDTTDSTFGPVRFVFANETAGDDSAITNFGLYGGWTFHKNGQGTIEMKFYATSTNESDIYLVNWNAASTKATDGVAISLRTVAPVVPDSTVGR